MSPGSIPFISRRFRHTKRWMYRGIRGTDSDSAMRDALGKVYTVKASDYGMVVLEGLPDWDMREAKYVSELGDARPEGHHWGERQTVRRLSARL